MGEIILIAVVALLVLGPERLPGAAKAIGKGIRDLRAQTKDLKTTIEHDTEIGEAVREIRGALRGDPETLYKRATGEDFVVKEEPPDDSEEASTEAEDNEEAEDELHAVVGDPDLPVLRTPASAMARGDSPLEAAPDSDSDNDQGHG